jgi:RNA recognition motif-containing protein
VRAPAPAHPSSWPHVCPLLLPVSQVPFSLTWQQLKDTFAEAGPIAHADIPLHPDGKSKGYGIVTFETAAGADKAIGVCERRGWSPLLPHRPSRPLSPLLVVCGVRLCDHPVGVAETFTGALMDGRPIEVRLDRE